ERILALSEESGDIVLIKDGLIGRSVNLYHSGDLVQALEHFKQGLGFSNTPIPLPLAETPSGISSRLAKCLWLLGFLDQALAHGRKLLEMRHQYYDFTDRLILLDFVGMLYAFLLDAPTVKMLGDELSEFGAQYGFPFFASNGY